MSLDCKNVGRTLLGSRGASANTSSTSVNTTATTTTTTTTTTNTNTTPAHIANSHTAVVTCSHFMIICKTVLTEGAGETDDPSLYWRNRRRKRRRLRLTFAEKRGGCSAECLHCPASSGGGCNGYSAPRATVTTQQDIQPLFLGEMIQTGWLLSPVCVRMRAATLLRRCDGDNGWLATWNCRLDDVVEEAPCRDRTLAGRSRWWWKAVVSGGCGYSWRSVAGFGWNEGVGEMK
ncbi:hypothetical protein C0Q70_17708 [Pomacea canaliculata]|uniref:Uncharacterized protein n=1 Tax=Pomacea canaliculata TaxID=400727 RepID=A0A2T7NL66_POMCA|nr:hypothetical protein C0Q70_17708 [Pomacea canaliculata]